VKKGVAQPAPVFDDARLTNRRRVLTEGGELAVENVTRQVTFQRRHHMSPSQSQ